MRRIVWTTLATMLLATPLLAQAQEAYVTDNVNIYAGPDPSYPLIATVYGGTPVAVQGCTDGWEWCDVVVADNRGWIPGDYLQYDYDNQPVLLPDYGPQIGIPIIAFSIGAYWDRYYRYRPFYQERDRWYRQPIPYHRPPPPSVRRVEPYRGPAPGGRQVDPYHVYGPYRGDPRAQGNYPSGQRPPASVPHGPQPGQHPPPPHDHPEHPHHDDNNGNGH